MNKKSEHANTAVGVVGLGVMGKNLALNMLDQGFTVYGLDRVSHNVDAFVAAAKPVRTKYSTSIRSMIVR